VWVGPDGVVRKHWARVADAAKHPAQVLQTVLGETVRGTVPQRPKPSANI
jgi:hypothetical protein